MFAWLALLIQVSAEMLLPQKDFTYPLNFKEPLGDSVSLLCLVVIIALFTIWLFFKNNLFICLPSLSPHWKVRSKKAETFSASFTAISPGPRTVLGIELVLNKYFLDEQVNEWMDSLSYLDPCSFAWLISFKFTSSSNQRLGHCCFSLAYFLGDS